MPDPVFPDPPTWTLWFAVGASALLFVQRFFAPVWNFFRHRAARRLAVIDDYWFRKVLMPQCMEPLQDFFEEKGEQILSLNDKIPPNSKLSGKLARKYDQFAQQFQTDKERLVRRFFVLRAIDAEIHETLAQLLDGLEDRVLEFCYEIVIADEVNHLELSAIESTFSATNRDIIERMIAIHRKVF